MYQTQPMVGHLMDETGRTIMRGGFMPLGAGCGVPLQHPTPGATAQAILARGEKDGFVDLLERGGWNDQQLASLRGIAQRMAQIERAGVVSTATGFPVRENLEAPARLLVPVETPFRNMLPRLPGSGLSSLWRQITSLGGGWGPNYDQPGGGTAAQIFFAETGAPATLQTTWAAKSAAYKLLGALDSITGLAMFSGANFQPQRATEERNSLLNVMLNEENALINGNSTVTAAPWGDGSTALAYDGILNLVTVANGTPSAQVQTSVGALTTSHIDSQLRRLWNQGGRGQYMIVNGQEALSMNHLMTASGSVIRFTSELSRPEGALGNRAANYLHPISGELVPIMVSRFMPAGTMIFGSSYLPDGSPAADVEVLPQVELPALAPGEAIQGYVLQPIAPTITAPQVYAWLVSVVSVLRLKSAVHFAKSTGLTAV